MRIGPKGLGQRHRGQTEARSWGADTLARFGGLLVIGVLVIGVLVPCAANASVRPAPDPSPQRAPATASPGPDPAPQAVVSSQPSHGATSSTTSTRTSAPIVPRIVRAVPAQPHLSPAVSAAVPRHTPASPKPAVSVTRHARRPSVKQAPSHHARPAPGTRVSLPFLVTSVRRLTSGLLVTGKVSAPGDGLLLLLSSLAMAALAVSSFVLLRRLRRLGGPTG